MISKPIESMAEVFSLKGKTAIVTGGNKGIGLGIATAYAQQGANIAILARDAVSGEAVVKDFTQKYGGKYAFYKADVTDLENIRAAVDAIVKDFGEINILVNNAGVGTAGTFLDMDENISEWFHCMDVDLNGVVRMTYVVARVMREQGKGGKIVNISSNAGDVLNRTIDMTAYCTAKIGVNMFTKGMALELAQYGIQVNAIAPGFTQSNLMNGITDEGLAALAATIPTKRIGQAIEIGALATYLASEAANQVTGTIVTIDGGHRLGIG